jgi:hypothetical protein
VNIYLVIPLWLVVIVICLFVFPFGVLIGIAGLIISLIGAIVWQKNRHNAKREAAISKAVAALPKNERVEWGNREGRYSNPWAVPRGFPSELMNSNERERYQNRRGEFAE